MTMRPFPALSGATCLAETTDGQYVAASATARTVTTVFSPPVTSATLSGEPGFLLSALSYLWVVTTNGRLIRLHPTTLVVSVDSDVGASSARWLASTNSTIIVPGTAGGIQIYSSSGTRLSRVDKILPHIEHAVASGGYLYVFGGDGVGVTLTVSSAGVVVRLENFSVPNVRGVVRAKVYGTNLYIASQTRESITVLSLATPATPTVTTLTAADAGLLFSVTNDSAATPVGTLQQSAFSLTDWFSSTDAAYGIDGYAVLHGNAGRVSLPYSALIGRAWDPLSFNATGGTSFSSLNHVAAFTAGSGQDGNVRSVVTHATGKWYAEITVTAMGAAYGVQVGITLAGNATNITLVGGGATGYAWSAGDYGDPFNPHGYKVRSVGAFGSYGISNVVAGDIISVVFNADTSTISFWLNGVDQGVLYASVTAGTYHLAASHDPNTVATTYTANFGASPFAYTIPTGYLPWGTA